MKQKPKDKTKRKIFVKDLENEFSSIREHFAERKYNKAKDKRLLQKLREEVKDE